MVVSPAARRTSKPNRTRTGARTCAKTRTRGTAGKRRGDAAAARGKTAGKSSQAAAAGKPHAERTPRDPTARMAAPAVRLGMTPAEVRLVAGQPECILFGSDDHVEWQFGAPGLDPAGAPALYVTTLSFSAGRVMRITERLSERLAAQG